MTQLDLFAPRQHHSPTSVAAAERIAPHLSCLQQVVLDKIRESGPLTDNEGIASGVVGPNCWRARRVELCRKGLVKQAASRNGSACWQAVEESR